MFHFSTTNNDNIIPDSVLSSLHVILVLGGGVPTSPNSPPEYVKIRCDAAAIIYQESIKAKKKQNNNVTNDNNNNNDDAPSILCLSAGTAHLPQLINPINGLPIWESTASAAYILEKYPSTVSSDKLFVETTSYDTISNAFYTRTNFTDIIGWKNILVITNEFHMNRTNAIFDWIFHANDKNITTTTRDYKLHYLSCPDISLSEDAIHTRKLHEAKGERNVRENLSKKYTSMQDIWTFLTSQHDFYTASKLARKAMTSTTTATTESSSERNDNNRLKDSYGG